VLITGKEVRLYGPANDHGGDPAPATLLQGGMRKHGREGDSKRSGRAVKNGGGSNLLIY